MVVDRVPTILAEPEWRVEGHLKVTGAARYTSDLHLPGTLHARFLTSPLPHARFRSIDASAARAVPGVHAVLTGGDIGPRRFGKVLYDQPVLAHDRVRFIGERVAAVAAESLEAAEEALGLIEVAYEELPAVFDGEDALRTDAPMLHPDAADYYYAMGDRPPVPHPNLQGYRVHQKGAADLAPLFAHAHRVFEHVYYQARQHQGYIEPHACIVWIDEQGIVRVYSTNKAPFALRQSLAVVTGLPAQQFVVESMFIGGDFGGKGLSIDEYPCYYLAKAANRPIKSVMTYTDELGTANPRHGATCYLRTAVDERGRIVAHESRVYFHDGAYAAGRPLAGPILDGWSALDAYNVPNARMETFVVYTNTVTGGQMRAPGASTTAFIGESHVDEIARGLGMDPLAFRLLNAVRPGDTGASGDRMRNPRAVEVLEALRRETDWGKPLPPHHGRGVSLRSRDVGGGKAAVTLRLLEGSAVEVLHGAPDQGGGSATVMHRITTAVLDVRPDRVHIRYAATDEAPPNPGAGGSRLTRILGQATIEGATHMKRRLQQLAAEMLGWPADGVRLQGDQFVLADGSAAPVPFDNVADRMLRGGAVETGGSYDSAEHEHEDGADGGFCAYMVEVEVDPASGAVRPVDAVLVADVGTVINPLAHQGQLEGGFVFGMGNGLMEELRIEDGKVTTLSLGDYKLPTVADVPPLRTVLLVTDTGPGPFGAKAAGELTNNAVAPAYANAVADAVGVRIRTLPITAERVFEALRGRPAPSERGQSPF
ncbi:MAG: molybdopterin-dependent oxidoreductase [Chloroflexi bacterium]|nr:molybdopterin-dependent oxidoreductase [Chloroflexota bacterium]